MWFRSTYSCLAEAVACLKYELGQRLLTLEPNNTFKWQYELFPATQSILEYPLANTGRLALRGAGGVLQFCSADHLLCYCVGVAGEALHLLRQMQKFTPDTIAPFYLNTA